MNLAAYAGKSVPVIRVPWEVVEVMEAFSCAVEGSGTAGFLPTSTKLLSAQQRLQWPGSRLRSEAARAQSLQRHTGQLQLDGTGIKGKGGGNLPR